MSRFHLFLAIFLGSNFLANAQMEECMSPRSLPGVCVIIWDCPIMVDILKSPRPLPEESLDFLKSSQCGFKGKDPMVCCEPEDEEEQEVEEVENPRELTSTTEISRIIFPDQKVKSKGKIKIIQLGTTTPQPQLKTSWRPKPEDKVENPRELTTTTEIPRSTFPDEKIKSKGKIKIIQLGATTPQPVLETSLRPKPEEEQVEVENPRDLTTAAEIPRSIFPDRKVKSKGKIKIIQLGSAATTRQPEIETSWKPEEEVIREYDYGEFDNECISPRYRNGYCISIWECKPVLDILRGPQPLSANTVEFLRRSKCGTVGKYPKVCCEKEKKSEPAVSSNSSASAVKTETLDYPDVTNHPNLDLLNDDSCGPVPESKILGGEKTGIFDYPWMALITYRIGRGRDHRCGGTVINKRYILTAAHCVTALPPGWRIVSVRVGEHNLRTERDCDLDEKGRPLFCADPYRDYEIESVHFHPEYSRPKFQNDIALIRVRTDIDFTPYNVKPICLPVGNIAKLQKIKVMVLGWGITEKGRRSPDLLQVSMDQVPNEQCAKSYKFATIWHKQMCAGGQKSMDSCKGDSGGPLQAPAIYKNNVRYVQYGIVSFGPKICGIEGVPGVYTTVAYYMDWILNTIRR